MTARVSHRLNKVQLAQLLNSSSGPVARDLLVRGHRVQAQAKRNLGGGTGSGPRRVDYGRLRASIAVELRRRGIIPVVRIGTNLDYALYVHNGTGIYGPRHTPIVPVNAKALRWYDKGGQPIFRKSVKGMKPNPFLALALPAAKIN